MIVVGGPAGKGEIFYMANWAMQLIMPTCFHLSPSASCMHTFMRISRTDLRVGLYMS